MLKPTVTRFYNLLNVPNVSLVRSQIAVVFRSFVFLPKSSSSHLPDKFVQISYSNTRIGHDRSDGARGAITSKNEFKDKYEGIMKNQINIK